MQHERPPPPSGVDFIDWLEGRIVKPLSQQVKALEKLAFGLAISDMRESTCRCFDLENLDVQARGVVPSRNINQILFRFNSYGGGTHARVLVPHRTCFLKILFVGLEPAFQFAYSVRVDDVIGQIIHGAPLPQSPERETL
jgi:hypothetical protein